MEHHFYSMIMRMKYIDRWGLMRNTWKENLSVHAADVAILTHALAVIGQKRLGKTYDIQRAVLMALYHDASEIITGDLPTPVKYHNQEIISAYRQVEKAASLQLLDMLPKDIREEYTSLFCPEEKDKELWKLVKAADKLSAYIKCIEEEKAGNTEFIKAKAAQLEALQKMESEEVTIFLEEFMDGFSKTLDEQQ